MAAATCSVVHNWKTKTIVYTFSEKIYFDLIVGAGVGTKIEAAATIDLTKFAVYKPALSGTYAAPAAGNVYTDVAITSITFPTAGTTLTVTYSGDFDLVDVTAFGYIVYPILYKAYTAAADTDSSANNIQACFASPTTVPVVDITDWNTKVLLTTALAIRSQDGALYTPVKRTSKCVLLLFNADQGATETVVFYDGDHIRSIGSTTSITLAAATNGVFQPESSKFLHVIKGGLFEGKIYFTGTSDVTAVAVELA